MFLQKGFTVWFTGISGSGKTTLSNLLHRGLQESGTTNVEVLDGEDIKIHLSKGLGFTKEDRDTQIRRIGWVAHLLTKNNIPNLVAAVSPYRGVRDEVRKMIVHAGGKDSFVEVFVDCSADVCDKRHLERLTSGSHAKEPEDRTWTHEPYERPHNPEVRIKTDTVSPQEGVEMILKYMRQAGLIL
ncbi:MAG: adenylyl-sulfate kinase [Deltaproteobacteria bacterium]|nr:adenylyl-sulfate kinase [Deltaproteobacteria bacterium]